MNVSRVNFTYKMNKRVGPAFCFGRDELAGAAGEGKAEARVVMDARRAKVTERIFLKVCMMDIEDPRDADVW